MSRQDSNDDLYIDANGCLTERRQVGDSVVIVHYDDIPESDIVTIHGIPCTSALRTVIDLAPEIDRGQLERMVREFLDRGLFTRQEAFERMAQPDMRRRPGAPLLAQVLSRLGDPPQPG